MAVDSRNGEGGTVPFRTDRFFAVSEKWYFSTREGFDSGPYANKSRADEGLKRFLKVAQLLPASAESNFAARAHRLY